MTKKPRPAMPEMPADELRQDDNGTGSAIELAAGESPYPPNPWPDDAAATAKPPQVYEPATGDAAMDRYETACRLFREGRPFTHHCPTNIPRDTIKGRAALFNALQPGDLQLAEGEQLRIRCRYWIVYPDRVLKEDGKTTEEITRTALVAVDGSAYRTSSEYGPSRAVAMQENFLPSEWENGIPLVIQAVKSRRAGRAAWHSIRVDMEALPSG